jgi:hypothetical protein
MNYAGVEVLTAVVSSSGMKQRQARNRSGAGSKQRVTCYLIHAGFLLVLIFDP